MTTDGDEEPPMGDIDTLALSTASSVASTNVTSPSIQTGPVNNMEGDNSDDGNKHNVPTAMKTRPGHKVQPGISKPATAARNAREKITSGSSRCSRSGLSELFDNHRPFGSPFHHFCYFGVLLSR